jgi:DeoR/GlpR family transcriptional regulator of sugar metabolism
VVRVKRALMNSAERKVMLLASSKFKRRALNHFADLTEFDRVFIDKELDEASAQRLSQAGITFELV